MTPSSTRGSSTRGSSSWRATSSLPTRLGRVLLTLAATGLLIGSGLAGPPADAATRVPAPAAKVPVTIEAPAAYVPAVSCEPGTKAGTAKLGKLLTTTYPGTTYGGARSCGSSPNSEHHDGRAVDWMNSVRDPKQAAQAKTVIAWLLATDAKGNTLANARRLGVMYIIWNNKIWGAYNADAGWRPYSSCADHPEKSWDTTCHRNHVHLSLSWAGAMGRTSYWTGKVAAPDYGPCRAADLSWARPYFGANPTPCPRYGKVATPRGASATLKSLISYSGQHLRRGSTGAAVTAVQRAIKTTTDGVYGVKTEAAVASWQRKHGLTATGKVYSATWRALIKDQTTR